MKFCPQCNSEYKDSIYFCLKDGAILKYLYETPGSEFSKSETKRSIPKPSGNTLTSFSEDTFLHITAETVISGFTKESKNQEETETVSDNSVSKFSKQTIFLISSIALFSGLIVIGGFFFGFKYINSKNDLLLPNNQQGEFSNTTSLSNSENNNSSNPNNIGNSSFGEVGNINGLENTANSSPTINQTQISDNNPPNQKTSPAGGKEKKQSPTPVSIEIPEEPTRTPVVIITPTPNWKPPTPKPMPTTVSGGVVNGKAIKLVTPPYPEIARRFGAFGSVHVEVLIDENGNVISAKATSGHNLLKSPAENAARASKFSPTYLSGVRVKVSGMIIYNFRPN